MALPYIAAFDLATATGVADSHHGIDKPRLWTWHLDDAGSERAPRLGYLWRLLDAYFAEVKHIGPAGVIVAYELPLSIGVIANRMKAGIFNTSEATLATLRGSIGVLEACASHHGITDIRPIVVQDARKHLTGQRTFRDIDPKDAVMKAAGSLGWDPQNDNEADAAAIWSLVLGLSNPRLAHLGRADVASLGPLKQKKNARTKNPDKGTLFDQKG